MFDRKTIKERAKKQAGSLIWLYVIALVGGFLIALIGGYGKVYSDLYSTDMYDPNSMRYLQMANDILMGSALMSLLMAVFNVFKMYYCKKVCLIKTRTDKDTKIAELFSLTDWKEFFSLFLKTLVSGIFLCLITMGVTIVCTIIFCIFAGISLSGDRTGISGAGMLLIIPAAIVTIMMVHYQYFLIPFISIDQPEMGIMETIKESRRLMNGSKWAMFVMDCLSFIGWDILVGLTCGILSIYVEPYKELSRAGAYITIKNCMAYEESMKAFKEQPAKNADASQEENTAAPEDNLKEASKETPEDTSDKQ
jgi:uncharacterized membrane protein